MPDEQAAIKAVPQSVADPKSEVKQDARPRKEQKSEPKAVQDQKKVSDVLQSVHIAIDSYDDIFSDFDPSPFETRILSDDFLNELRKRYAETPKGAFSVTFTLPRSFRSEKKEALIRKRIKDYFKHRLKEMDKVVKERITRGSLRVFMGIVISLSVIIVPSLEQVLVAALISPLVWYLMWSGFESIFEADRKLLKKKNFLERFMKAEYIFRDQEEVVVEVVQYASSSYR